MASLSERLTSAVEEWAVASGKQRGKEGAARTFTREMEGRLEGGKAGTSYRAVLTYMSGESEPSLEWLRQAADLLGVRFAWLVAGEGEPTEEMERASRSLRESDARQAARGGLRDILPVDAWPAEAEDALLYAWLRLSIVWISQGEGPDTAEENREIARTVARCVKAPLDVLGIPPESLTGLSGDMYVSALTQAIIALSLLGTDQVEVQVAGPSVDLEAEEG